MKRLVPEFEFTSAEREEVRSLARALNLTEVTAGILYARGQNTEEKMRAFLSPSKEHFLSPFLMQGMKEAVALLNRAKEEGWNVAVFGDYDADGIGALTILSRALKEFGIEPYLYVPERTEGYGMNVNAIDKIFDEFLPDLFITVDCGISNAQEVEYIKEQGAYVIVTDHHELPETLPDCVIVNPKLQDDYPYDNLCGAGVAFKLATALIGEKAYGLLDFCALSTVADSVPLLGENRDIVAEGLRLIEKNPRPAFAALLGKATEVTAQTLAFTVAPRINAAGRMGDAHAALSLFTTDDEGEIFTLAARLNAYNAERQKYCDDLYAQASAKVREEGAYGNVVMLAGEDWNAGFVGIVAARIAEEFSRPALLFVRHGDMLKGSARSIENVNIFEALKGCSQYIEEFGGHSQAAGVNVRAENFEALKEALGEYIGTHYAREDFIPRIPLCATEGGDRLRIAREINRLEPFGVGNRRPMFALDAESSQAAPLKTDSPHVALRLDGLDLMYFGGGRDLKLLRSDVKKTLVFEYNLSKFRGREYLKGFVRTVLYDGGQGAELAAFENAVRSLARGSADCALHTTEELDYFIAQKRKECAYGLLCVCSDRSTLSRYSSLDGLETEVFRLSSGNCGNAVLYAPDPECDFSAYRDVVYLDRPAAVSSRTRDLPLVNGEICGYRALRDLAVGREELLAVFSSLRAEAGKVSGTTYAEAAESCDGLGFGKPLFLFALAVFEELGLVSLSDGRLAVFRGVKTDLNNSAIYRAYCRLGEEE